MQGLPPTIGKEVEDMQLDNFQRIDDCVEEWGVETTGKGSASYTFDDASGNYDVRISYFDQKDGQSKVRLFVGNKEVLNFSLDEDVNCWRWRVFKNIQVNRGDEIRLVAEADGKERARLGLCRIHPGNEVAPPGYRTRNNNAERKIL